MILAILLDEIKVRVLRVQEYKIKTSWIRREWCYSLRHVLAPLGAKEKATGIVFSDHCLEFVLIDCSISDLHLQI